MKYDIGENIRRYRQLNGMSQKYLAAKLGLTPQGLLKIEKGEVSPRAKILERAVDVLCITPNQLFGIEEISEENSSILYRIRRETEASLVNEKNNY